MCTVCCCLQHKHSYKHTHTRFKVICCVYTACGCYCTQSAYTFLAYSITAKKNIRENFSPNNTQKCVTWIAKKERKKDRKVQKTTFLFLIPRKINIVVFRVAKANKYIKCRNKNNVHREENRIEKVIKHRQTLTANEFPKEWERKRKQ